MGLNPGGRSKRERRLVDMSTTDEEPPYRCPEGAVEDPFTFDLGDGSYLTGSVFYLDGLVVWFALVQYYTPWGEADPIPIARIDCCHRSVHEHRYNQRGEDVLDHRVIREIPLSNGRYTVHDAYDEAYETIFGRWEANLESWRRS